MGAVSVDIKDILVAAGIGAFGSSSGWSIAIGKEPVSPDTVITIYDTPGDAPNPKWRLDYPQVQIRVRGSKRGYTAAHDKMEAIKNALLGRDPETVNSSYYAAFWMVTDTYALPADELERPLFVTNWRFAKQPASGTYRTAL